MKVEDTKIYEVLKEVFEGTPEWPEIYANLKGVIETCSHFNNKETLPHCFVWGDTGKGHTYWFKINKIVSEYQQLKEFKMKSQANQESTQKPLISMDKQYTQNGKKVRVLCVDRDCNKYPVVALVDGVNLEYFTAYGKFYYDSTNDRHCLEEYNPWQDVVVDTKVLVTYTFDGGDFYHKRHFSHYEASTGVVYVFGDGKTSFTSESFDVVSTATAKLA